MPKEISWTWAEAVSFARWRMLQYKAGLSQYIQLSTLSEPYLKKNNCNRHSILGKQSIIQTKIGSMKEFQLKPFLSFKALSNVSLPVQNSAMQCVLCLMWTVMEDIETVIEDISGNRDQGGERFLEFFLLALTNCCSKKWTKEYLLRWWVFPDVANSLPELRETFIIWLWHSKRAVGWC